MDLGPSSPDTAPFEPELLDQEIERISALPPAERAAALEAFEARLRATLDEIPAHAPPT